MKRAITLLLCVLFLLGMTGCGAAIRSESYSSQTLELGSDVRSLHIQWTAGEIHIQSGDSFSVSETSNLPLDDKTALECWDEGGVVHLFYTSGRSLRSTAGFLKKTLTVTIPPDASLRMFSVEGAAADVTVDPILVEHVHIVNTSGSVQLALEDLGHMQIETVSGSIHAEVGCCDDLELKSSSGSIEASLSSCVHVETTSSSGQVFLSVADTIMALDVSSSSGRITLALPEEMGFTAHVAMGRSEFKSELPVRRVDRGYVSGDGSAEIELESSSGDVFLQVLK